MRSSRSLIVAVLAFGLYPCVAMQAQTAAAQTAAAPDAAAIAKEAASANALYNAQNLVGALPLYEDLHKQQPESNLWRERLAMCVLASSTTEAEAAANLARAHKLLLDAKAAGDNSNLLQVMLEKIESPVAAAPKGPESPGAEAFHRAEKAFSSGNLPGALQGYKEAMAADPKMYEAPLYAGDTEFKLGHYPEADQWYARAAALDPNRETAFRYWGDCLMKQGDPAQAEGKFIDAVVAEPYTRASRLGLKQWADTTKTPVASPPVALPPRPKITTSEKDGYITSMTVGVDAAVMAANKDSPLLPAITAYEMGSSMWVGGIFHKTYPTEKLYRHSLGEEAQTIHAALTALTNANVPTEKLDATWKTLAQLDKDGMLECWILLDHADQGIAQDYAAYRAAHRDLLHQYIATYDVHSK
jgi:tetratricopeptide (TPR) repeat protein